MRMRQAIQLLVFAQCQNVVHSCIHMTTVMSNHMRCRAHDLVAVQGNCSDEPPAVPDTTYRLTPLTPPRGTCQILLAASLFNWTNGEDGSERLPSQPNLWLHGLHIVNIDEFAKVFGGAQAYSIVHFAPPQAPRLWLTNMHFQGMHNTLLVGKRADAFIAGACIRLQVMLGACIARVAITCWQYMYACALAHSDCRYNLASHNLLVIELQMPLLGLQTVGFMTHTPPSAASASTTPSPPSQPSGPSFSTISEEQD